MAEGYVPINTFTGGGGGGGPEKYDRGNPMVYGDNFISKAIRGVKRMQGKDPYGRDTRVSYEWDQDPGGIMTPANYWSREYRDAVEELNQAKKKLADDPTDKYSNHKDNIRYYTNHIAKIKELLASNGVAVPPVAEGDNMSTFEQDRELAEMLKYAGVPVKESVLTDSTGSTLEHIKNTFRRDVKDFTQTGNMSDPLYDALYDYYFDDMPYGTKKARDGDPYEWISNRFSDAIGLDEGGKGAIAGGLAGGALGSVVPGLGTLAGTALGAYAGHKLGDEGFKDPDAAYKKAQKEKAAKQQTPPVAEGPVGKVLGGLAGAALTKTPGGAMAGARLGSAVGDAMSGGEETAEGQHTQHGMDATPGRDDYKDEKFADIKPMSFRQDPIQATTDRALKYSAQGVNKLRDLFREDEEAVVENQDKFSALSGQYGHSGKLQKFDDVEQDVLARLKQLSGMIRS